MSNAPYLQLISEVLPVQRRDFYVADPSILNPNSANPVLDGEWLSLDSNYKLVRLAGDGIPGVGTLSVKAFQVFAERGRFDTQSIGKTPVLFSGAYEAETSLVTIGSLSVNDELVVGDVSLGGQYKKGLVKCPTTTGTYMVVGHVTRLPGGGKVRYLKDSPYIRVYA